MERLFLLYTLLILPGLVGIIRGLLQNVYLWQVKEYRLDRFISHYRYEKEYSEIGVILWLTKVALLIVGSLYILFPDATYLVFTYVVIFILYFLHLEWFLLEAVKNKLVRPSLRSSRNLIILTIVSTINFFLFGRVLWWLMRFDFSNLDASSPNASIVEIVNNLTSSGSPVVSEATIPLFTLVTALALLGTLAVDLLVPLWVAIMVVVTSPISKITRNRTINKAKQIISSRGENLKVIAITGSYGKTTTKDMIHNILSKKYKTAKTIQNKNTAVGVAQSIIPQIKSDTEVFVVEMGAYKQGEIGEATSVVPPDIALVTALTQQHLSLFGSSENLFNAKFELINGLKPNGVAVFNGNDENCIKMATKTNKKKVFFYQLPTSHSEGLEGLYSEGIENTEDPNIQNENVYLSRVTDIGELLEVEIVHKDQKYSFKAPLKDVSFTLNLLGAIAVCLQVGMSMEEIIKAVEGLPADSGYLNTYKGVNDSVVIDDGKTSNLVGFQTALSVLEKKSTGRKWVITQGILDLGSERKEVYQSLAKDITQKADGLITTDKDLVEAVKSISSEFMTVKVEQVHDISSSYRANIKAGDTVLLEGPFPTRVISQIKENDN